MKLIFSGLITLMLINSNAYAVPTNEQLYQMLLEMKTEQEKLKKEVAEAKIRESDLQTYLDKAKAELVTTKKQRNEPLLVEQPKTPAIKEGFFTSAGALYVKPLVDENNTFTHDLNYEPGFQVSAGYQAPNNWDYTLKFKRFTAKNTHNSDVAFYPSASKYQSKYNTLDLEIGKHFLLSDNVALRLSGGIRYAALDERNDISQTFTSITSHSVFNNDFWNLGPRITAAPTWTPFRNFRVFGNVGTSFLMGQLHETMSYGLNNMIFYNDSRKTDGFTTLIEASSGIGYTLKNKLLDIDVQAGYQFEHWLANDQTNDILFRGFHGSYSTVGIKF